MAANSLPPGVVERWTFLSAWEDGPWLASVGRWDSPVEAAQAAAAWLVSSAQAQAYPRVRVQTIREIPQ